MSQPEFHDLRPVPRLKRRWLTDFFEPRLLFIVVIAGLGSMMGAAVTATSLIFLWEPTEAIGGPTAPYVSLHVTSSMPGQVVINGDETNLRTPATVMVPSHQEYVLVGVIAARLETGSNEVLVPVSAGSVHIELPSPFDITVPDDVPYRRLDIWSDASLPQTPTRDEVHRILRPLGQEAAMCGQGARGVVLATVVFAGATGRPVDARVDRTYRGTEIGTCVEQILLRAQLPRFRQTTLSVRYPVVLHHE